MLGNLPENVIDDILMCLPFKDAVRTSVLSKKWRYNWCRLPELTLDQTLWKPIKDYGSRTIHITKIIHHILTLHSGPVTNFTLCIHLFQTCPNNIDSLIDFLSRNGIQDLVLKFPVWGNLYELPSSIFTCFQLRHLTLEDCLILCPPSFKGFGRLISLELCDVSISSKCLESLISGCPLLEQFLLEKSDTFSSVVEINAPNLKSLDFIGSVGFFCLKNIPRLEKLSLMVTGSYNLAASVKCDFALHSVKHLRLSAIYFNALVLVKSALCLIRSFPNLQYMEIQVTDFNPYTLPESLDVKRFSNVTFNHLEEIKIEGFIDTEHEMEFMKLLLAKSPVLVRMFVKFCRPVEESARAKMLARLSKVNRASPKAEVNFIFRCS